MGHSSGFVSVQHLASGIDEVLALLAEEGALEAQRPQQPSEAKAKAFHAVVSRVFPPGVRFNLNLNSRAPGAADSGIWLQWIEELPLDLQPPCDPEVDWEAYRSWVERLPCPQIFCLDVDLFVASRPKELFNLWNAKPNGQKKADPDLRKIRSVLEKYARPRLILPTSRASEYRDDCIALGAMFLSKEERLRFDDDLSTFFRNYCTSRFHASFDRLYRRNGTRGSLPTEEWHSVIDRAFDRIYRAITGRGFAMPATPNSFRAYVRQVLRGEAATVWRKARTNPRGSRVPATIEDAAERLGVSLRTLYRWMKRLNLTEWSEATWEAIRLPVQRKALWQTLQRRYEESGCTPDAARKQVQRGKRKGLSPDALLASLPSAKVMAAKCSACGDAAGLDGEDNILTYAGKPMCASCWCEKTDR
jgi:hypothetical protein